MSRRFHNIITVAIFATLSLASTLSSAQAGAVLTRHVREVISSGQAQPVGKLPGTQSLRFDIVLPLRDRVGLQSFLQELYDPASPFYHQFITPAEFTARFGPAQQDWDALVAFAKASGFEVVGGSRDGRDLWLNGTVANIDKAFHVTMTIYQDPEVDGRTFYSPDREPTTSLSIPLWHVTGLDNDAKPHPLYVKKTDYAKAHGIDLTTLSNATTGSGPSASFLGSDMRAAYYCNGSCGAHALTGTGQNIALFEFAGTDLADLTTYYNNVGQTEPYIPTLISTGGYSTTCLYSGSKKCDDGEQNLDMTQAMGMAPGSTMLYMYVCGDVLANGSGNISDTACISAMVTDTDAPLSMQISCSWGWTPADASTLDPYFEQMASQGQNFFAAAGDDHAWSSSNEAWPADDANIVSVGGTDLTTSSAAGPWSAETAWTDSGGGISPDSIPIPSWQQLSGVITSSNKGSTTLRNGPDVAANANFTFYTCGDQEACEANEYGGTSFAAPMWAGYLALANQQAAANGESIGFINPIIYPAALSSSYSTYFHDITSGSCGTYSGLAGYDLCTGWGSPNTNGLINLLAPSSGSVNTTTAVSSSLNPSTYGQAVTFTATVTAGSGTPTGTVQFSIDGSAFGSPVTLASGSATSGSISTLTQGTHTVTAAYSGASGFLTSSGTLSGGEVVNQASTTTAVASSLNPSAYGQAVSFTATVTGSNSTGTVQFSIDGSAFGSPVTLASGVATSGSISTLTQGTHTVTAAYSGDTNHTASSGTLSGGQAVNQATAAAVVTSSLSPSVYGQSVTFTATINGEYGNVSRRSVKQRAVTGTVAWSANTGCGTTNVTSGNPGIATCTTSILAAASDTITATYSGDSNHGGSSGTFNQSVNQAATTIGVTGVSPSSQDYGSDSPVTITAVLSWSGSGAAPTASAITIGGNGPGSYGTTSCGAASGNTITCTASYTPTGSDAPGSYTETAAFAGDSNYSKSSSAQSGNFTINQASAGTVVTSSQSQSNYGQSVTFTATISGENGNVSRRGVKQHVVSGTVAWSANTGCGTTNVTSGNPGIATCTTTSLAAGAETVTATYSGDGNHGGSSGSFSQTVNQASQTITFTTPPPVSAKNGSNFTVAATGGASGNPVTFTSAGSCSNSGATYTMTSGTGTCSVIANQAGNNNYTAAPQLTATVSAGVVAQTITFTTPAPATAKSGDSFTVAATGGASGNPVTFTVGAGSVCSLSGATYTMTSSTGYCYVVANQAGNSNYSAAPTVTETVTAVKTVTKIAPTVTFTGAPANAAYLSTFTVSTTQNSGVTPKITSTTGSVCSVSGDVVTMKKGEGTCTVKATWATNDYYLAASAEQSTTATLLGTTTSITNTVYEPANPLKVEVYFTASNGTSTVVAGNVTVSAATGQTCTGTVAAGKCLLTFTATGSNTLTATYAGNTEDAASTSAEYPLTVY